MQKDRQEVLCDLVARLRGQLSSLLEEETAVKGRLKDAASRSRDTPSLHAANRGYVDDLKAGFDILQTEIHTCKGKVQVVCDYMAACLDCQAEESLADFLRSRTDKTIAGLATMHPATIESMGIWNDELLVLDTAAKAAQVYDNHRGLALDAGDTTLRQEIARAAALPLPHGDVWKALNLQMDEGIAAEEERRRSVLTRASFARAHIQETGQSIDPRHASMRPQQASSRGKHNTSPSQHECS